VVCAPHHGLDAGEDHVFGFGLDDIVVRAGIERFGHVGLVGAAGQHDDRGAGVERLSGPAENVEAVNWRHHPVEDDEIERVPHHRVHEIAPVPESAAFVPAVREQGGHEIPDRFLVIRHCDPHQPLPRAFRLIQGMLCAYPSHRRMARFYRCLLTTCGAERHP
jgi:hypothetical protein